MIRTFATALTTASTTALLTLLALTNTPAFACGGFFCQTTPINQAGEQIVFRQEGNDITAMVRILYSGSAEQFSWVVPVPSSPDISLGADTTFDELEFATRPQFILERRGEECEQFAVAPAASPGVAESDNSDGGGVVIEEELTVGPFDIDIVSSDNPDDLAIWLQDNGYQLTDRGSELIVLRLRQPRTWVCLPGSLLMPAQFRKTTSM